MNRKPNSRAPQLAAAAKAGLHARYMSALVSAGKNKGTSAQERFVGFDVRPEVPASSSSSAAAKRPRTSADDEDYLRNQLSNKEFKIEPLGRQNPRNEWPEMKGGHMFEPHPFRAILVGASSSGKTVCAVNFVCKIFAEFFDDIILHSPNANSDPEWASAFIKPENMRDDFDREHLMSFYNKGREEVEREGRSKAKKWLYIMDDKAADHDAMRSKELATMYTTIRHRGGSIMVIAQKWKLVAPTARTNANIIIFYAMANQGEVEAIIEELRPMNMAKKEFEALFHSVVSKKHHALVVHPFRPLHLMFWENFTTPINVANFINDKRAVKDGLEEWKESLQKKYEEVVAGGGIEALKKDKTSKGDKAY